VSDYLGFYKAQAMARMQANTVAVTPNQAAYDARTYDLDVNINMAAHTIASTVKGVFTVTAGPLTTLDLDLRSGSLTVDAVTSGGVPATFTYGSDLLTVNLDRSYATGENVTIVVTYHGTPTGGSFGSAMTFTTVNGLQHVYTVSEPFEARDWWPCKDTPDDKADSVDVKVTVPTGMITAGNGTRVAYVDNGTTSFTHWKEHHKISTYLVSLACYPYTVTTDWYRPTATDSMPIMFFNYPGSVASVTPVQNKVKSMIGVFASKWGAYRFQDEKYGHGQCTFGGGMENQTCTSLGSFSESVVAHELCHQWFGDAVTCADFHNVWLNEGFATYGEAIWVESQSGTAAYHTNMDAKKYFGAGTIYCPDLSDPNRVFSGSLSYQKPSWVLHMLRHIVGDATFFTAMQTYVTTHQYGNATTEDLRDTFEAVSGRDLHQFFNEWIYGEYYPSYDLYYSSAPAGGGYDVTVQVRQTQTWQTFWMPIDIRVNTGSGPQTFTVVDSLPLHLYSFHVNAAPTSVTLDPDGWVLKQVVYPTAVGGPGPAATLELSAPQPNPMREASSLSYSVPRAGLASLRVIDAAGRQVATLEHGRIAAGVHRVAWNGRGDDGRRLSPGVYWAALEFEGRRQTQRLAILN